ncbi:family 78 glycoside hydrolase catalytic domain [Nakamurella lactea]|uniref:family 78 glycoside hydrolase catalytic domain n=1 Tax=Nakamurella lactea TaxID=459515 RepID=UPI000422359D|nr:family 78 glycoside hydrolase catalytic domain [Nakamurella lactea]
MAHRQSPRTPDQVNVVGEPVDAGADGPPDGSSVSRRLFLGAGAATAAGLALGTGTAAASAGSASGPAAGSAGAEPAIAGVAAGGAGGGLRPVTTTTGYAVNPLGTDVARPRFGWEFPAGARGTQAGYQLQVSSSEHLLRKGTADVWDSGRVASAATGNVAYAGPSLAPRTRYFWRVRSWDGSGRAGSWSDPGWFETALLGEGWGGASWIGNAPSGQVERTLTGAKWIWTPGSTANGGPTGTRRLRGRLAIPAGTDVAGAYLVMTADDYYTGYLGGQQILSSAPVTDGWRTGEAADVTEQATAAVGGELVLAAEVTNAGTVSINPGGLLARLVVVTGAGQQLELATDSSWKVTDTEPAGWQQPEFDDSGWEAAAELASYGQGPWGSGVSIPQPDEPDLVGTSWVWAPGSTANDGAVGTRYLRAHLPIPAGTQVRAATLVLTADDDFTGWLQGEQVASVPQRTDAWRLAQLVDVTDAAQAAVAGELVVAVRATNRPGASVNPGGVLGKLVVHTTGDDLVLVTGASWLITDTEQTDWQHTGFDDSSWDPVAVLAPYGQGPWGSGVSIDVPMPPAPLLRREFAANRRPSAARLYVSAAAYAVVQLNGRRVSDAVLEPGFTDYDKTMLYVTHDVTDLIRKGSNVIGAELGRGFYGMLTSNAWNWNTASWHGEPRLLVRLILDYPDGSSQEVVSDADWRISDGPTVYENLYAGESYDATKALTGWAAPGFDASGWAVAHALPAPKGELQAQQNEPIRVVETVAPVTITKPADGVWVADFGRTVAGWTRLRATLPAGTTVRLTHGEVLAGDGTVVAGNGNAPGRCQQDEYTAAGTGRIEEWEPSFVYHGFRYVQLDGLPAAPTKSTVQMRVVHSDIADAGTFRCSEPLFEKFEQMMRRTVHNNLHGIPTDTPMYEKNGWTGDAQVAAPTMAQLLAMQRLFSKWLGDLRDSQVESGQIPVIVPSGSWGYTQLAPAPEWTTVYPFVLREMHRWYGDTDVLREHYPYVVKYLDWELRRLQNGLAVTALGDYLSPGTGGNPPEDTRLTATAYLRRGLLATAEVGELIGVSDDVERYRAAADALRDRLNAEFLDTTTGHYRTARDPEYRQTSNVIPLAFDLVPDEYVARVFDSLVADITARGNHLNTGCLGTSVLLPTLTRFGRADLAAAVALQRSYPSWGYWVDNGADTMWEFWQIPGRSRDHYFQGTVVQWLQQNVAGLRPVADGWRELEVRPDARVSLSSAAHTLQTVRGEAGASWRSHRGQFSLNVTVPAGSTATVYVPAAAAADTRCTPTTAKPTYTDGYAVYTVTGGRWRFTSSSAD